jgi:hypothetical protein
LLILLAVVEPNAAVTEDDGAVVALSYVFLVALVMELIRLLLEAVAALSEAMLLLLLLVLIVLLLSFEVDEDESRVFECDLDLERLLFESRCLCSLPLALPLAPVDSNCSPAVVFGDLEEDRL